MTEIFCARPLIGPCIRVENFREPSAELAVGGAHNMTVSWRGGRASISSTAVGGGFDDGGYVDSRDWPCLGGPAGDWRRYPEQGVQCRQHADSRRCDRGLDRRDHARPLAGGQGTEDHRPAAWPWRG